MSTRSRISLLVGSFFLLSLLTANTISAKALFPANPSASTIVTVSTTIGKHNQFIPWVGSNLGVDASKRKTHTPAPTLTATPAAPLPTVMQAQPTATQVPPQPTATQAAPTATPVLPTATPVLPTATFVPAPSTGHTYYVSNSGSDSSSGTSATAPLRTIQQGINKAVAGDTVYVRAGTYSEQVRINKAITLSGYPGEQPVIDGQYTLPAGTPASLPIVCSPQYPKISNGLVVISVDHASFQNFRVVRSAGLGILKPIDSINNDITVRNVIVDGARGTGIGMYKANNSLVENSTVIDSNNFAPCSRSAGALNWGGGIVYINSTNSALRGTVVYHNWGEGVDIESSDHITLDLNTVYDNYAVEVYLERSYFVTVQRSLIYSTNDSRFYRDGNPSVGLLIADEAIEPTYYSHDFIITNNLLYGNSQNFSFPSWSRGDANYSGLSNSLIAYNTIVNAHAADPSKVPPRGMTISRGNHSGARFLNNIVVQQNEGQPVEIVDNGAGKNPSFLYNLYSGTPVTLAKGSNDKYNTDPQLNFPATNPAPGSTIQPSYFTLRSTSPAINAALTTSQITYDYYGTSRGSLPDIGAHEVK